GKVFAADTKVVYRRYASLYFLAGCAGDDNELLALETLHRFVEVMDGYFRNVCELDIVFDFAKAYYLLDELLLAGEVQESSRREVLKCVSHQDQLEALEVEIPRPLDFSPSTAQCFSLTG
ncbi:hypothetical protein KEM52_003448, partial [Ascosphaera acerosa]